MHLHLTKTERKLVCGILVLPDEYIERIKSADPASGAEFTAGDLEDFAGYVAFEANHTTNRKKQKALDGIFGKIENLLNAPEPCQEQDAEPLRLPIKPEDYTVSRLGSFVDEIEEATGMKFDAVLEGMKPVMIASDEKVGLNLKQTEKEILRSLPGVPEQVKKQIKQAAGGRRKFEFTLPQIDQIEATVAKAIKAVTDKKTRLQWNRLHHMLSDLQAKYVCGADPENALSRTLSGEPISRAAAIRDMMAKLLEARKQKAD